MTLYAQYTIAVRALTPEQRAKSYVQKNQWSWPEAMPEFKPPNWDVMSHKEKYAHEGGRTLMRVLDENVSEFDKSHQWWLDECDKTAEQHLTWWLSGRNDEMIPPP